MLPQQQSEARLALRIKNEGPKHKVDNQNIWKSRVALLLSMLVLNHVISVQSSEIDFERTLLKFELHFNEKESVEMEATLQTDM